MFFIIEKSEETTFEFLQHSVNILWKWKQKIVNLLNSSENEYSKFATKGWYIIDSESKGSRSHRKPIVSYKVNKVFVIILMHIF